MLGLHAVGEACGSWIPWPCSRAGGWHVVETLDRRFPGSELEQHCAPPVILGIGIGGAGGDGGGALGVLGGMGGDGGDGGEAVAVGIAVGGAGGAGGAAPPARHP